MKPDRGAMAVGNLPLFPSTVCQSASRKGSKSVNIFVTAWESARLWVSKAGKEHMIVFWVVLFDYEERFTKKVCVCWKELLLFCAELWKQAMTKSSQLYLHWEAAHVSHKVLRKWYRTLFTCWHSIFGFSELDSNVNIQHIHFTVREQSSLLHFSSIQLLELWLHLYAAQSACDEMKNKPWC